MRILVLGGTKFLGRHTVDVALTRVHDVTLFNRGQTRPELFPDVEKLQGDRDGDLTALAGRTFDAVVDTSGYIPRIVQQTLDALDDVGHYTYWPQRLAAGGRVLAPAPPGADAQVIDARDLAAWIVRAAESGTAGT